MKPILFVLLLAMGAFAAEAADGSNLQTDGSNLQTDGSILRQDSSAQQAADSLQQSVGSAQTSDTANNPDGNSNWPNSAYVICEMPDDDDDPETTVMENIGLVNDSLAPLGEYVEWADSSKVADSLKATDSSAAQVADTVTADTVAKKASLTAAEKYPIPVNQKNILLPGQTAYIGEGLSVGIGVGIYNPTEECDCMGIWQAQVEYFYADWVSAEIDVRFLGGDVDDGAMLMYQRYRVQPRFHKAGKDMAIYAAPVFGFETTSISEFREQVQKRREQASSDDENVDIDSLPGVESYCEKLFSLDGFSMGASIGFGWNFSQFIGLSGSVTMEYNFSKSALLTFNPGLGLNVREVWPWAKKNLRSMWVSAEMGVQKIFNRGAGAWAMHNFLGIQVGI